MKYGEKKSVLRDAPAREIIETMNKFREMTGKPVNTIIKGKGANYILRRGEIAKMIKVVYI